ncbi:putative acyl-CoA synthetase CCNA_01223 [Azospirillaceae bacterium]
MQGWAVPTFLLEGGRQEIVIYPGDHGPERRLTLDELVSRSLAASRLFQSMGVEPGDRVMLLAPTGALLLQAMLGAWFCGAAFAIAPPNTGETRAAMTREQLLKRVVVTRPKLIVASGKAATALPWLEILPGASVIGDDVFAHLAGDDTFAPVRLAPNDLAYLQFTSGSTGSGCAKAVIVTHAALTSNLRGIAQAARIVTDDCMVSWAPAHHDMGLVGGFLQALFSKLRSVFIPVETFSKSPWIWVQAISEHRGTLSPSPTFSYTILQKLSNTHRLSGIDLSSWRYAWIGAEPIFPEVISRFNGAFRTRGLSETTLRPSYGLAESVVAISCSVDKEPVCVIHCDPFQLRQNGRVRLVASETAGAIPLVGNGPPIAGMTIKIADEVGTELPSDRVGHIWMKGPSVTPGYFGVDDSGLVDGWRDTGDLGFLYQKQVFVSGRAKEVIIRGGVNIAPQDIEWMVEQFLGLRPGRVVAFSDIRCELGREEVVVVAETRGKLTDVVATRQSLLQTIVRATGLAVDHIEFVPTGSIPRTTSGKVQRSRTRDLYRAGELHKPSAAVMSAANG